MQPRGRGGGGGRTRPSAWPGARGGAPSEPALPGWTKFCYVLLSLTDVEEIHFMYVCLENTCVNC